MLATLFLRRFNDEQAAGRFGWMKKHTERAPWQASPKSLGAASTAILSGVLKIPDGWPPLINYFDPDQKKLSKVQIHLVNI